MKLWKHQEDALKEFSTRNSYGLFFEMGTGKTLTAIECYKLHAPLNTLIIAPSIVLENWKREFHKFSDYGHECIILNGTGPSRIKEIAHRTPLYLRNIYITNHEALSIKGFAEALTKIKWDFLIVDESHRFKGPTNQRSKVIHKIADNSRYKLILTGSPVLNSYEDIWSQLRILDANLVGENFFAWRKKHFRNINLDKSWIKFPTYTPHKDSIPYMQDLMSRAGMTVKKEDVLDLPPLVKQVAYVDLSPETAKHYKELEKLFVTIINDDVCATDLIVTKMLRMQQITAGLIQGEESHLLPSSKMAALSEYLDELCPTHKVIVWCNWRTPLAQIKKLCDKLGLYYTSIEGGQSAEERQEQVDLFNMEAKYSVCIANQKAGGVGIGLQAASYMIYFSKGYSLEENIQSEARAYRGGSEIHKSITRIDLITRGTIDEDIHAALEDKVEMAELIQRIKEKYGRR